MKPQIIKLNNEISIDIPKLIQGRLAILANSGGGKSQTIRKLAEEAVNQIQVIILDPEGEFSTLREKYDFILCGKDQDVPVEVRSAAKLAEMLLESKASAIIDLFELHQKDRTQFVKIFCETLTNAPKSIRNPCIFVLDEAHDYVPEGKPSEATLAVENLVSKGRKRKIAVVLASQRISKVSKDALSDCANVMIGRATWAIDRKRAAEELGLVDKKEVLDLKKMSAGEFYAVGPAISDDVVRLQVGKVKTTHGGDDYLEIKSVPPSPSLKKALAKLADVPAEAEKEARTVSELKAKIVSLQQQKVTNFSTAMGVTQWLEYGKKNGYSDFFIEKSVKEALQKREIEFQKERKNWESENGNLMRGLKKIEAILTETAKSSDIVRLAPPLPVISTDYKQIKVEMKATPAPVNLTENLGPNPYDKDLRPGARKLLETLASRYPMKFTKSQMALLVGFKPSGGTFSSYLSNLRTGGYIIEENGLFSASERGIKYLGGEIPRPKTPEETRAQWRSALRPGAQSMFDVIMEVYPNSISKEELGERLGMIPSGGTFSSYLSNMRTNGMIVTDKNNIRASDDMF